MRLDHKKTGDEGAGGERSELGAERPAELKVSIKIKNENFLFTLKLDSRFKIVLMASHKSSQKSSHKSSDESPPHKKISSRIVLEGVNPKELDKRYIMRDTKLLKEVEEVISAEVDIEPFYSSRPDIKSSSEKHSVIEDTPATITTFHSLIDFYNKKSLPTKTDIKCFYCHYCFDNPPYSLPVKYLPSYSVTYGSDGTDKDFYLTTELTPADEARLEKKLKESEKKLKESEKKAKKESKKKSEKEPEKEPEKKSKKKSKKKSEEEPKEAEEESKEAEEEEDSKKTHKKGKKKIVKEAEVQFIKTKIVHRDIFLVDGIFCSETCGCGYLREHRSEPLYKDTLKLLFKFHRYLFNGEDMKPFRDIPVKPWRNLVDYGGKETIEEFRAGASMVSPTHQYMVPDLSIEEHPEISKLLKKYGVEELDDFYSDLKKIKYHTVPISLTFVSFTNTGMGSGSTRIDVPHEDELDD